MVAGAVYASGMVEEPLGNIIEVRSDVAGYRKFVSITDLLCNHLPEEPVSNSLDHGGAEGMRLVLNDGILQPCVHGAIARSICSWKATPITGPDYLCSRARSLSLEMPE
ncbi:MAG: hypothetical protein U9N36_11610 [Euryarchaeota archaeon]|nr:hypothetical protein [Euryarchaeota archaeon]